MGLRCCFGMTSGVGNNLLKLNFLIFFGWLVRGMLWCKEVSPCRLVMRVSIIGTLLSQEACMIGKRKAFLACWLYLWIWIWMLHLRVMKRLFSLLILMERCLLRVDVVGCMNLIVLFSHRRPFESLKFLWKPISWLRWPLRAKFPQLSCWKEEISI